MSNIRSVPPSHLQHPSDIGAHHPKMNTNFQGPYRLFILLSVFLHQLAAFFDNRGQVVVNYFFSFSNISKKYFQNQPVVRKKQYESEPSQTTWYVSQNNAGQSNRH